MARTSLTQLIDLGLGGANGVLRQQRLRAAETILERVWSYPQQREAIETIARAKLATLQANRGGGKTEGVATWLLARCISRDGYVVRIGCQTLEGPTDTILDRESNGGYSTLGWIARLGLAQHCQVSRAGASSVKRIRFSWGSSIHVHDFETLRALERKRGVVAHFWWFDEAQSLAMLATVFTRLVVPRLGDHDGQVLLSGTPGRDLGTLFHRYCTQATDGWERVAYYSYDNVMHGDSDEERWARVLDTTVVPARKKYGLSRADIARMRSLTRDERVAIARGTESEEMAPWVGALDPDLLREVLGRWVVGLEEYLFAWHKAPADFYYCAVGPYWERASDGEPACMWETDAPVAKTIAERVALLPDAGPEWGRRPADWFAVIGLDIGSVAPSAIGAIAYANDVPAAYCLYSETRTGMADGELLDWITWLIRELQTAGVSVTVVVADINGMRQGTGKEWDRSLRQRLPAAIPIVEAYKVDEDSQMLAINLDIAEGRLRLVCGDALDICGRHLRWEIYDPASPKPARPDLGREVTLPDDTTCYPSNHATDMLRYAAMRVPLLMREVQHRPRELSDIEAALELHRKERRDTLRHVQRHGNQSPVVGGGEE